MIRLLRLISLLLILIPLCDSTGIVWIRMSSSKEVVARIEFTDKENSSRYGISLDLALSPDRPKEFVLPIPPASSGYSNSVFDYSIQMLKCNYGSFIGQKTENSIPIGVNEPWIHRTTTDKIGIYIFTSIRFECLPNYYGSNCQYYCSSGEKCPIDECPNMKCENDSKCQFDGKLSKCLCSSEFSGKFCEKNNLLDKVKTLETSVNLLIVTIIIITFFFFLVVLIAVCLITMIPVKNRMTIEPMEDLVHDFSKLRSIKILTPEEVIFANL